MDVTPMVRSDQQIIQSYTNGKFRVSGEIYDTAVIILPDQIMAWDAPNNFSDLTLDHLQPLINMSDDLDVLLLGCGAQMAFLDPALREELKSAGLSASIDTMDTGAACRTYNVLMAEGRRVAAALFLF